MTCKEKLFRTEESESILSCAISIVHSEETGEHMNLKDAFLSFPF